MADADMSSWQPAIDAVTNLARAVGVPGAALLIIALGAAWKLDSIFATMRGMVQDFYSFRLQKDELHHKMQIEGERLEADARRELQLAMTQKGSET